MPALATGLSKQYHFLGLKPLSSAVFAPALLTAPPATPGAEPLFDWLIIDCFGLITTVFSYTKELVDCSLIQK